jgi:hypothetical protein
MAAEFFSGTKSAEDKHEAVIARPFTKADLKDFRESLVMSYNPTRDPNYVTNNDIMIFDNDKTNQYIFSIRIMKRDPVTLAWIKTDKFSYMDCEEADEKNPKYKRAIFTIPKYTKDKSLDERYTRQYNEYMLKKQHDLANIAKQVHANEMKLAAQAAKGM